MVPRRNCASAPRLIRPWIWEYIAIFYLRSNSRDSCNEDIVYLLGDRNLMFKHYLDELRQWWGQKEMPFPLSVFVMRRNDCKILTTSLLFVDPLYTLYIPSHIYISLEIASAGRQHIHIRWSVQVRCKVDNAVVVERETASMRETNSSAFHHQSSLEFEGCCALPVKIVRFR